MSHVVSSQPSSTSPYQPTEIQESTNGSNPTRSTVKMESLDSRTDDCCFHANKNQGIFSYYCCNFLSSICGGIRDCTERCCDCCANCLNDCCEDKPDDRCNVQEYRPAMVLVRRHNSYDDNTSVAGTPEHDNIGVGVEDTLQLGNIRKNLEVAQLIIRHPIRNHHGHDAVTYPAGKDRFRGRDAGAHHDVGWAAYHSDGLLEYGGTYDSGGRHVSGSRRDTVSGYGTGIGCASGSGHSAGGHTSIVGHTSGSRHTTSVGTSGSRHTTSGGTSIVGHTSGSRHTTSSGLTSSSRHTTSGVYTSSSRHTSSGGHTNSSRHTFSGGYTTSSGCDTGGGYDFSGGGGSSSTGCND